MLAHPANNLTFRWVFSKGEERADIEQVRGDLVDCDDCHGDDDGDDGGDDEEEEDLVGMVIMLSLQGACGLLHVHLCSQPW